MTQNPDYLHYLEMAKRSEVMADLEAKGFTTEIEKRVGDVDFDLLAHKGDRFIAYEFKSVGSRRISREQLVRIQQSAKQSGYEFRVVIVNPPPRVNVEIDVLKRELLDYVVNQHFPDELNSLSSNTVIEGISDVEVSDIRVSESGIFVQGSGSLEVSLEYGGGEAKDGVTVSDSYPFHFSAHLKPSGRLDEVDELSIDTSSFFE